ncbi:MAG: 3'-5' exonuclease [Bacteroidales bacterium]|nr:3'-5' exonuclease [Bacteroidales bacterium]MBN2631938.1 3'-5' exonuclease [Bacteroidales bacterium]
MELLLKRPLVFLDLETTGINITSDRIVEISLLKILPGGEEEWLTTLVNPGISIPAASTAVHGISDKDVADAPSFGEIAVKLEAFMEGCDLAGFNAIKFDIPLLAEEFLRVESDFNFRKRKYVDVQVIFHKKEQRTLSAAYRFYCRKELTDAHTAEADTLATYEVLKSQLDMYPDLENDVEKLAEFSSFNEIVDFAGRIIMNDKGVETFNFGKYKGRSVGSVFRDDPSYYSWIMNGDFPLYTKRVLTELRLKTFGNRKE